MAKILWNYLTWTTPDGTEHASVPAYSDKAAEERKKELEAAGCTVKVVQAPPGKGPAAAG